MNLFINLVFLFYCKNQFHHFIKARQVAGTKLNPASSRSHMIISLKVQDNGILSFYDLGVNKKVKKAGTDKAK